MVDPKVLDTTELFGSLGRGAREALAARAVARQFKPGDRLWHTGDEPRGLFVILSGQVRVVGQSGRRQHVVHVEGPGATLGEVPFFGGGGYPATAIAAEATRCLVVDRASLRAVMAQHPDLAWALLARLATRVRRVLERLSRQTSDPIRSRLAAFLLARPVSSSGTITLGGTQSALAEELGTVREVVVRHLGEFVASGWLERRGRGEYLVRHAPALATAASGAKGNAPPRRAPLRSPDPCRRGRPRSSTAR